MKYRNLDPLDVSLWGRHAAFRRNLLAALRAIPQAGKVAGPMYLHDSVLIDVGELTSEDVSAALAIAGDLND